MEEHSEPARSSHHSYSIRKSVLKNFSKFTGKQLYQRFFFIKKESLAQVFSCQLCKIFKNTFFTEHFLDDCFWPTQISKVEVFVKVISGWILNALLILGITPKPKMVSRKKLAIKTQPNQENKASLKHLTVAIY